MKRFLIIFSILNLLIFSGCFTTKFPKEDFNNSEITNYKNPYFNLENEEYIYRTTINFYKKEFTGILIIKKLEQNKHRIVLSSDFGNTLLDLSISNTSHELNYTLKDLNKKILIKTIVNDFRNLIQNDFPINGKIKKNDTIFLSSSENSNKNLIIINSENQKYIQLKHYKNNHEKVRYLFDSIQNDQPKNIKIIHQNFKLSFYLQQIIQK